MAVAGQGQYKTPPHLLCGVTRHVWEGTQQPFVISAGMLEFVAMSFKDELNNEWLLLRKIHEEFFFHIANNKQFQRKTTAWLNNPQRWPWDTSPLKIIDNLVIGAMKA